MARKDEGASAMVAGTMRRIRRSAGSWFGLGVFWSWFWILIQRPSFDYQLWDSSSTWRILTLSSCAVMFACVVALNRTRPAWTEGRAFANVGMGVVAAFSACCVLSEALGVESTVLEAIKAVLSGAVVAFCSVLWGRKLARFGTQSMFLCCTTALVVAFAFAIFVFQVNEALQGVAINLLPLLSMVAYAIVGYREAIARYERGGRDVGDDEAAQASEAGRMSLRFLVTVFVMGAALGLLHALFNTVIFEACDDPYCPLRLASPWFSTIGRQDFYGYASVFGLPLTLAVIVVSVSVFHMNFRKLVYQVGFPLMALGFLVIASDPGLASGDIAHVSGTNFTLGELFYISGYYYTEVIVWSICAYLIDRRRANATSVFSWTGCTLIVGQLVGFFISFPLSSVVASQTVLCLFIVFALLFSGLSIVSNDSFWQEWGEAHAIDEKLPGYFKQACCQVFEEARLTDREGELAVLLVHGRNADFIASELFISRNTVKTHARSIYRKLEIHSQQELIDMVERRAAQLRAQERLDPARVEQAMAGARK